MRIRPQNAPNTDSRNRLVMHDRVRVVSIGVQGLPGPHVISGAYDVDLSELADGSVLEYDIHTKKYRAINSPRNLTFNCGHF